MERLCTVSDIVRRTIADLSSLGEKLDTVNRERIPEIIIKLQCLEEQQFIHLGLLNPNSHDL